jgi:hypothetical protein
LSWSGVHWVGWHWEVSVGVFAEPLELFLLRPNCQASMVYDYRLPYTQGNVECFAYFNSLALSLPIAFCLIFNSFI